MAMNCRNSWFLFPKLCTRKFHNFTKISGPANLMPQPFQDVAGPNWRASLAEELQTCHPEESDTVCIYRVPTIMREVDPKAYTPNIVSIGPYHRGLSHLREMEKVKRRFFCRLFNQNCANDALKLEVVIDELEEMEEEARSHYSEEIKLSSEKFVEMMLIDGCFVTELLRELEKYNFTHGSALLARWMLPILRRDFIMLENQLPLSVLQKLFLLTSPCNSHHPNTSLQELALRFFTPSLHSPSDSRILANNCQNEKNRSCRICSASERSLNNIVYSKRKHFVDLLRFSLLPTAATEAENSKQEAIEEKELDMIRSAKELKKAGMVIEKGKGCLPLDVHSEGRAIIIPPLYIDDYRGTVLRNMLAFEQCHHACKPQVTAYLFFLDGLVNCVEDVKLLRRIGVIQHCFGSNKDVVRLVNSVCKNVARDNKGLYLHKVLLDANIYLKTPYAKYASPVLHHFFGGLVMGITSLIGIFGFVLPYFLKDHHNAKDPESTSFSP